MVRLFPVCFQMTLLFLLSWYRSIALGEDGYQAERVFGFSSVLLAA